MDEEATAAATVVLHDDSATARLWFETIRTALAAADEAGNATSDRFVAELRSAVRSESSLDDVAVDTFAEHLTTLSDPLAAVRGLADPDNIDVALELHDDAVAESGELDEDDAEPVVVHGADEDDTATAHEVEPDTIAFDLNTWFGYLAQWDGGWDGEEKTWSEFVRGFLAHAPDGTRATAVKFVDDLTAKDVDDRIDELASYSINITPADAAAVDEIDDEPVAVHVAEEEPADDEDMGIAALMNQFMDEDELAAAVEKGDLKFEPIEDDELDLAAIS